MKENGLVAFLFSGIATFIVSMTLFLFSFEKEQVSYTDIKGFESTVLNFTNTHQPDTDINFNIRERNFLFEELTESSSPSFFQEERYRYGILLGEDYRCDRSTLVSKESLSKDEVWMRYFCSETTELPFSFFDEPPYLSKSGYSFVYLAIHSHIRHFMKKGWIKVHRQYLSMPELLFSPIIREVLNIPDFNIDGDALSQMSLSRPIIRSKNKIYFLKNNKNLIYEKYTLKVFEEFLEKEKRFYFSKESSSASCVYSLGSSCFGLMPSVSFLKRKKIFRYLSLLFLLISGFFLYFFFRRLRFKGVEENLRKLALDNLTHDLRTPVSNLLLLSNKMDEAFKNFNEGDQIRWIELNSQIHKLRRLTEESSSYINMFDGEEIKISKIASLNSFFEEVCMENVELSLLSKDESFYTNPYWLHVCIKNLVDNALNHGGESVLLKVERDEENLVVRVIDSGTGLKRDFIEMKKEFVKNEESNGMGLGLSISSRAVGLIKGSLSYESNPTMFVVKIKDQRKKWEQSYARNISH